MTATKVQQGFNASPTGGFNTLGATSFPSAPTSGNILIVHAVTYNPVATINPPSGFTLAVNRNDNYTHQAVFYKVSNGTEQNISTTSSTNHAGYHLYTSEWSGLVGTAPLNTVSNARGINNVGLAINSGTINEASTSFLALVFPLVESGSSVSPSNAGTYDQGFTKEYEFNNGANQINCNVGRQDFTSAQPTLNTTFSWTGVADQASATMITWEATAAGGGGGGGGGMVRSLVRSMCRSLCRSQTTAN